MNLMIYFEFENYPPHLLPLRPDEGRTSGRCLLSSQDFDKLVDAYHVDVGEWCLFENVVVMVFCNDIAGISLESTIYKFVIIGVCGNQTEMIVYLNHFSVGQVKDSGYNV